jgi:hypothetical protein
MQDLKPLFNTLNVVRKISPRVSVTNKPSRNHNRNRHRNLKLRKKNVHDWSKCHAGRHPQIAGTAREPKPRSRHDQAASVHTGTAGLCVPHTYSPFKMMFQQYEAPNYAIFPQIVVQRPHLQDQAAASKPRSTHEKDQAATETTPPPAYNMSPNTNTQYQVQ